jgi:hypothetical protein
LSTKLLRVSFDTLFLFLKIRYTWWDEGGLAINPYTSKGYFVVHPYLCFKVVLLSLYGLLNFQSKLTFYFVIYIRYKLVLLFVLFVYFLYGVLFVCWLVYNYLILTVFICFLIFFLRRKNFNINYLHNPNIVAVERSQSFNVMVHFKNYLCLNWLILVFRLIVLLFHLFIY